MEMTSEEEGRWEEAAREYGDRREREGGERRRAGGGEGQGMGVRGNCSTLFVLYNLSLCLTD